MKRKEIQQNQSKNKLWQLPPQEQNKWKKKLVASPKVKKSKNQINSNDTSHNSQNNSKKKNQLIQIYITRWPISITPKGVATTQHPRVQHLECVREHTPNI